MYLTSSWHLGFLFWHRLKEELESYRKDEMENIYEVLQTEIEDLQMVCPFNSIYHFN